MQESSPEKKDAQNQSVKSVVDTDLSRHSSVPKVAEVEDFPSPPNVVLKQHSESVALFKLINQPESVSVGSPSSGVASKRHGGAGGDLTSKRLLSRLVSGNKNPKHASISDLDDLLSNHKGGGPSHINRSFDANRNVQVVSGAIKSGETD